MPVLIVRTRSQAVVTALGVLVAGAAAAPSTASAAEPTTLTAAAYLGVAVQTDNGVSVQRAGLQGYRATLTETATHAPVSGRTIVFTTDSQVCTAVTNGKGVAQCNLTTAPPLPSGYTASFAGDSTHLASSGSAPLVG